MDDVLPKPFTRKSLLEMLEKHLMHLKKIPDGMAPPQSATISGPQSTATHSVRDDMSAAESPAGSSGTWNSPGQYSGVSPVAAQMPYSQMAQQQQYMDANNAAYHAQNSAPHTPVGMRAPQSVMPQQPSSGHRRGPSEMTGASAGGDLSANKRQRIYTPNGQPMAAPLRQ